MIFGNNPDSDLSRAASELPRLAVIACYVALIAVPAFLLWWRYQRLRL
jgi:hypothetical protein